MDDKSNVADAPTEDTVIYNTHAISRHPAPIGNILRIHHFMSSSSLVPLFMYMPAALYRYIIIGCII